jgi:segregation and condensation protein A
VAYPIRLPLFEGPLDLLLHLIRTHKLDIRDIPIAAVTQQYLEYLELMEALDLDVAGEFLVMAATLMEIKSRMLLPRPDPPLFEDEGQDPRAELVARLLEYERFQQVAEQLRELAAETQRAFPRTAVEQWEGSTPLVELRPQDLLAALRRISGEESEEEKVRTAPLRLRRQAINLKQRMAEVLRRSLAYDGPIPFSALVTFAGRRLGRREVLVTFLAVLELVRLGRVRAYQHAVRGDIFLLAKRDDDSTALE